ncbi:RBBP9/YdeN family alpha/beta hydrolase [Oharaeibacter diazotrophicus]|uniref:Alpha/beta hydrolase n=1 Tax=Oharaeibacter diazotrophicus TaxID=1920512 RepID=A0A4R6RDK5_9HYPH|nr:alpha/beta hydrolase [Oharaeibacter diazotrophicus]TDP84259.1 hypothetical protein EDD54_2865 [Oharaeibacter diazotrophicus]BBE73296.1 alpha/beta hydrolase family protein [Pleomorphomonas sp. SM30]GLS75087.1 hypothetical protein GCM10007904_04220 [Oharaeibacter diazotrophicus]
MHRLVVPGYRGSPAGHWQHDWLRRDPRAVLVDQEDFDRPDLALWLERLEMAVRARPGSLIVAHSLGCVLVAHLAARKPDLPVAGALLVAPADVDRLVHRCSDFLGFAPVPRRPLPFPAIVVASRNDPYAAFDRAAGLADAWGAGLVDLGDAGHVNIASGHGHWPEGFVLADGLTTARAAA